MKKWFIFVVLVIAAAASGFSFFWRKQMGPPIPPPALVRLRPETYQRGEVIGEVEIPRLHLNVPVFEGDDAGILDLGAGHVPGTALPGQRGNICIAAHRDKDFRALRLIRPDDEIVLVTGRGELRFQVRATTIVTPNENQVLLPGPGRDLTLVTCYPFYFVGSAPRRFIVWATKSRAEA
jgi:sortase A